MAPTPKEQIAFLRKKKLWSKEIERKRVEV
jgi:hypothetical protein